MSSRNDARAEAGASGEGSRVSDEQAQSESETKPMLRIALVESDAVVAGLYVDALRFHLGACDVSVLGLDDPRLGDALAAADVCVHSEGTHPDGIFADLGRLLGLRADLPVILLLPACGGACERVRRAVECGAADVLLRTAGYLDQLPASVRRVALQARGAGYADARVGLLRRTLGEIRVENQRLQALVESLGALAATDALTGLPNRRAFERALRRAAALSRRYGHALSCLAIDADGLKGVNDSLGHAAGDEVLRVLGRVILEECRQSDVGARVGGDEFIVLLPHTGEREAAAVAERLRARMGAEATLGGQAAVSITVGVASWEAGKEGKGEDLVEMADRALCAGKLAGRNRVVRASGMAVMRSAA